MTEIIPEHEHFLLDNNYALAAFGWALYMVGKLWYYRDVYDTNHDGLGLNEIGVYLRRNWISFLFNAMLIIIFTPYVPDLWLWAMDLFGKEWPMTRAAYILEGGLILIVQLIIDWVKNKKGGGSH
jgi:hypothetical protein